MNWKELLKPTLVKIILFLILLVGVNYVVIANTIIFDAMVLAGFPLGFFPLGGYHLSENGPTPPPALTFSYPNFFLDLIFWYAVSCLLVFIYERLLKRS